MRPVDARRSRRPVQARERHKGVGRARAYDRGTDAVLPDGNPIFSGTKADNSQEAVKEKAGDGERGELSPDELAQLEGAIGSDFFYQLLYSMTSESYKERAKENGEEYCFEFGVRKSGLMRIYEKNKLEEGRADLAETSQSMRAELHRHLLDEVVKDHDLLNDPDKLMTAAVRTHGEAYKEGGFGLIDSGREKVEMLAFVMRADPKTRMPPKPLQTVIEAVGSYGLMAAPSTKFLSVPLMIAPAPTRPTIVMHPQRWP